MSKEAMKLALEGAANYIDALGGDSRKYRQALSETDFWEGYVPEPDKRQQALDKKAENARELGLDYEPVCNKDPQGCWNVRCQLGKKCKNTSAQPTVPQDIPDLIAGALGVSRGTAYDMMREALASEAKEQPAPVAKPHEQEPFGYFQYDIRLDAWVQNRVNNKGVAFYTKEKK